jgi:hypothetical protein
VLLRLFQRQAGAGYLALRAPAPPHPPLRSGEGPSEAGGGGEPRTSRKSAPNLSPHPPPRHILTPFTTGRRSRRTNGGGYRGSRQSSRGRSLSWATGRLSRSRPGNRKWRDTAAHAPSRSRSHSDPGVTGAATAVYSFADYRVAQNRAGPRLLFDILWGRWRPDALARPLARRLRPPTPALPPQAGGGSHHHGQLVSIVSLPMFRGRDQGWGSARTGSEVRRAPTQPPCTRNPPPPAPRSAASSRHRPCAHAGRARPTLPPIAANSHRAPWGAA